MSSSIVRTGAKVAGVIVLGLVGYLLLWPVPAEPKAWDAPTPPGFTGPFAPTPD